jgi:large subunit ribosomal protein L17
MRHRRTVPKLGRTASHRKAMLRNMVTSLFREERVETTVPKAKEARRVAERMITVAKRGSLHARRRAGRVVRDAAVLKKLFDEIAPRFAERPGGYTRILKTGFRSGDNAPLSILELLSDEKAKGGEKSPGAAKKGEKKGKKAKAKADKGTAKRAKKADKGGAKKAKAEAAETKPAKAKKGGKKAAAEKDEEEE